jgi:hypothetical protein
VDSNLVVSSDTDGTYDCQPIVYAICSDGEARDFNGKCVNSGDYCNGVCGSSGGFLSESTGTCQCSNITSLDEVCDDACRQDMPVLECGSDGSLVLTDRLNNETAIIDPTLFGSAGSIDCSVPGSSVKTLSAVSGSFAGVFGVSDQITGARRRRLLSVAGDSTILR